MVVLAGVTGVVSGVAGALVSAVGANLATGPLIVLAASALVVISILFAPGRGLLWEQLARRRARQALRGRHVLATLYELAEDHSDPRYPAERGTLDSFHGLDTRAVLDRLERRGLVERVDHMPDEGPHWELTAEGRREVRRTRDPDEA
jgi:manganese/zinc/iron transport system permease protein